MGNKQSAMFEYVEQWQQTNLTKKRFAEEHQLSVYSFRYWCDMYKQTHDNSLSEENFIEVHPENMGRQKVHQAQIEMTLPNGIQIKIY